MEPIEKNNSIVNLNVTEFENKSVLGITRAYYKYVENWTMTTYGEINVTSKYRCSSSVTDYYRFNNFNCSYTIGTLNTFFNYHGRPKECQITKRDFIIKFTEALKNVDVILGDFYFLKELKFLLEEFQYSKQCPQWFKSKNINETITFMCIPTINKVSVSYRCLQAINHNSVTCSVCKFELYEDYVNDEHEKK